MTPVSSGSKSVAVYRIEDIEQKTFSSTAFGENSKDLNLKEFNLNDSERQVLFEFYISDINIHGQLSGYTSLHQLKDSSNKTVAVIALEGEIKESIQNETVTMLLKIYQNFTNLINDNERDTLTGLLNRKTFELKINKVLTKMQQTTKRQEDKSDSVYFLAIFDIDHFKNVNDVFGHLIGDEVLLMFSQLMMQTYREKDLLFRFGGEEFVGVFECASADDIQAVLERFREKISNFSFPQVGNVTVSAGYTEILSGNVSSQLIDHADLALYYAKNNGRNRVCNYQQLIKDGALECNKKEGDIELF